MRFAPSLAAPLDASGARAALFNWLLARRTGGCFIVRIDDKSSSPEAEAELVDCMRWLGIDYTEGPWAAGKFGPYRTSERAGIYAREAQRLRASGAAYERDGALIFRMPPGRMVIDDPIAGRSAFDNAELGDTIVVDAQGNATPAFRAAVDDALMHIDVVLRGDEEIVDTPRALMLQAALDLHSPQYAHVGAIADGAATIAEFRGRGFLGAAVANHLARLGWAPDGAHEDATLAELAREFSLERIGRAAADFDLARLRTVNARELRALPPDELCELLAAAMQRAGLLETPVPDAARRWIATFVEAFGPEFTTIGDALPLIADLRAEAVLVPALELERLRNRQVLFFLDAVGQYVDSQAELRGLALSHDLPAIAEEFGISKEDAFATVRMALTGATEGAPLNLLFPLLGHDRILIRIGAINSHLLHGRGLEPIKYGPGGVPFETVQPERRD
ncbi:MAG: glutamate--tRNA ligase [Candidatus Velthaea sp.]